MDRGAYKAIVRGIAKESNTATIISIITVRADIPI